MKIYKISQTENNKWDACYEFAIVVANSDEEARNINPGASDVTGVSLYMDWEKGDAAWCSTPEKVTVTYLGEAAKELERGIIHAHWA